MDPGALPGAVSAAATANLNPLASISVRQLSDALVNNLIAPIAGPAAAAAVSRQIGPLDDPGRQMPRRKFQTAPTAHATPHGGKATATLVNHNIGSFELCGR
jgi:hypothetical protein